MALREAGPRDEEAVFIGEQCIGMSKMSSWTVGILKIHPFTRCWRKTVQWRSDDLHGVVSSRLGDFPRWSASHFALWTTCSVGDLQKNLWRQWNGFRNVLPLWIWPLIQDVLVSWFYLPRRWRWSTGRWRDGIRDATSSKIQPQMGDVSDFIPYLPCQERWNAGNWWDGLPSVTSPRIWPQIRDVLMTSQLPPKLSRRVGRRVDGVVGRTSPRIWPPIPGSGGRPA